MQMNPYLNFNGSCGEAFRFYAEVLGGKIEQMSTYDEMPGEKEWPDMKDGVMHVRMTVGDYVLMGSDSPPQYYQQPQGIHVSINVSDAGEAERIFNALSGGGTVTMPLEKTFWAERFGMCVDRFGTPWMVNCEGGNS